MCLDIVRRGIERVSVISKGYQGDGKHDWEQCQWCELNRDLVMTASSAESENRCSSILCTMWYAFGNDLTSQMTTPLSSNGSTPQPFRVNNASEVGKIKNGKSREVEKKSFSVTELVKLMWTTGLNESENWFEARKNDPRCAVHWAEGGFLTALIMGTKKSRKTALERLEFAEKVTETALKAYEANIKLLLKSKHLAIHPDELLKILETAQQARMNVAVSAEVFLFRAGSEVLQKDYPRGSIHFRNAWKQHKLCSDLQSAYISLESQLPKNLQTKLSKTMDSDIYNMLQFQEGIFLLSLSMAPPSLLRLAKISGMEADQSKGLNLLYKCISSKTGIRVSAALMFVLFWLLVYIPEFAPGKEDRFKEANDLIRFGNHYYPRSIYFSWLESYMCTRQGKLERSLKLLKRALGYTSEQGFPLPSPRLLFEKGWVLFLCQEWEPALSCLLTASDHSEPTPFTQLLLAIATCMVGNLEQAEIWFKDICTQGLEKITVEKWIGRRARRYLTRRWFQLFPYEVIYVTDFINDMSCQWLEQVLVFFADIQMPEIPDLETLSQSYYQECDEFCILLLIKGNILRNLGRLKESVRAFETVINYQSWIMHEKWIVPHAHYELGMVYIRGRDWKSGKSEFDKAKKFKKFDFRRSLNFKLNAALEFAGQEEIKEVKH